MLAADPPDDPRYRVRMAGTVEGAARVVEVDPFERRGKAVRIAFAPDFAVRNDVEAGILLGPDREQRRVVLRHGEIRLLDSP